MRRNHKTHTFKNFKIIFFLNFLNENFSEKHITYYDSMNNNNNGNIYVFLNGLVYWKKKILKKGLLGAYFSNYFRYSVGSGSKILRYYFLMTCRHLIITIFKNPFWGPVYYACLAIPFGKNLKIHWRDYLIEYESF